jgi:uncharacterized protein YceK
MIHSLLLMAGILASCLYGLAVWAALSSWQRASGMRTRLGRWLGRDLEPAGRRHWWTALVQWSQVAVAILVMPLAALVLIATLLALSLGMVLLALTVATACGCAFIIARAAAQRTSAPGL